MLTWAPLGAVDELEVEHHRLAVAGEAGGQPMFDLDHVERFVTFRALGLAYFGARKRRDERFRYDPGDLDLRRLRHVRGQDTVGDQEHVGVKPGPFMARPHLSHDSVDRDLIAGRQDPVERDDVVKL